MNQNEMIEKLKQYRSNEAEIVRLEEEIAFWRSRAEKTTVTFSLAPGGGDGDGTRIERAIESMEELEYDLLKKLEAAVWLRRKVGALIDGVEQPELRELLMRRYIDGLTWEQVAEKMHYSYRQICRKHGDALKALEG